MLKKHVKVHHHVMHSNKKADDNEQPIHVMIGAPIDLRKSILGSALEVTRLLKTHAELKEIRESKLAVMDSFRVICSDVKKLIRDLEKEDLPKVQIKEEVYEVVHEEIKVPGVAAEEPVPVEEVSNSEIEKLKSELNEIEKKLSAL